MKKNIVAGLLAEKLNSASEGKEELTAELMKMSTDGLKVLAKLLDVNIEIKQKTESVSVSE